MLVRRTLFPALPSPLRWPVCEGERNCLLLNDWMDGQPFARQVPASRYLCEAQRQKHFRFFFRNNKTVLYCTVLYCEFFILARSATIQ